MKKYVFEVEGAALQLEGANIYISGSSAPHRTMSPALLRLLKILLDTKYSRKIHSYKTISEAMGTHSYDTASIRKLKQNLIDFLRDLCAASGHSVSGEIFTLPEEYRPLQDRRTKYFRFDGKLEISNSPDGISKEDMETARARLEKELRGGQHIKDIIDDICASSPEKSKIFFTTDQGYRLPFHKICSNKKYLPKFPINIIDKQSLPEDSELPQKPHSLHRQRRAQDARLYPGTIYTIQSIFGPDWTLQWAVYTDIIESCDYISARLKEYWYEARSNAISINERREIMKDDQCENPLGEIFSLWEKRADDVLNNMFSNYIAGIAFSAPTFRIEDNGSLSLMFAEGSPSKQAGAGQKHVCPAGMLEFFKPLDAGQELTLRQFKAIICKELLEETVFGSEFSLKEDSIYSHYVSQFSNSLPGKTLTSTNDLMNTIENVLIPNWDCIWSDFPYWQELFRKGDKPRSPSLMPLRSIQNFDPDEDPYFTIVDALCFRPEIIIPIYQQDPLEALVNWEYKHDNNLGDAFEKYTWESIEQLEDWVVREAPSWCAPGIAAAYLGARHYFHNKEACRARMIVRTQEIHSTKD